MFPYIIIQLLIQFFDQYFNGVYCIVFRIVSSIDFINLVIEIYRFIKSWQELFAVLLAFTLATIYTLWSSNRNSIGNTEFMLGDAINALEANIYQLNQLSMLLEKQISASDLLFYIIKVQSIKANFSSANNMLADRFTVPYGHFLQTCSNANRVLSNIETANQENRNEILRQLDRIRKGQNNYGLSTLINTNLEMIASSVSELRELQNEAKKLMGLLIFEKNNSYSLFRFLIYIFKNKSDYSEKDFEKINKIVNKIYGILS